MGGQSAGSGSVLYHLMSPRSTGKVFINQQGRLRPPVAIELEKPGQVCAVSIVYVEYIT